MITNDNKTSYPSIDKPWMKHYSDEARNIEVPQMSMYQHVWESNKNRLDCVAMLYQKKEIKYKDFFEQVDLLSRRFVAEGIKEGDIVTVISLNTPETIFCFYALNRIGATVCFEYATQSEAQLRNSIQSVNPKMVIVLNLFLKAFRTVLEEYGQPVISISPVEMLPLLIRMMAHKKLKVEKTIPFNIISYKQFLKGKRDKVREVSKGDIPAVMISTSGSTGIPKKVELTNKNINSIVVQYIVAGMELREGGKFLSIAPPFLSFGITLSIHLPLSCGLISIISTDPSPENSAKMFVEHEPNYFLGGVEHVVKICEHPDLQKSDLKYLHCFGIGGESMSPQMREKINLFLKEHNAPGCMLTGYGMTELSGTVTSENNKIVKGGSVGTPLPLINIKIVDKETSNECTINQEGEVLVSSPGMMKEYYKNVEETKNTIEIDEMGHSWVHTGDLGYIDEDGFLFIKGRLKRIFRTFSDEDGQMYKLYPDYIESEINKISFVRRSAVIVVEDKVKVNVPIAFIQLSEVGDEWIEMIVNTLSKVLPSYDMPVKYIEIEDLPLLTNGKIDYRKLEEMVDVE